MERNFDHHEQIDLPPGFRFHPTDEELISHYLYRKVFDSEFESQVIGEVDLNRVEPWELPWKAKHGEKEWFFFCIRDRKYPTGTRTNRATRAGYWKATGKDKEIFKEKSIVGMKKTLVFYKGRAPKGEKTDWVMHEYRLEGMFSEKYLPKSAKGEWVISRVFHKSAGGKNISISGLLRMYNENNHENEFSSTNLPPLMDISSADGGSGSRTEISNSHVTCFSEFMEELKPTNNQEMMGSWSSSGSMMASRTDYVYPMVANNECQDSTWMQEPSIVKVLLDANNMNQNPKMEMVDDQDYGMNLVGQVDLDYMWNY